MPHSVRYILTKIGPLYIFIKRSIFIIDTNKRAEKKNVILISLS